MRLRITDETAGLITAVARKENRSGAAALARLVAAGARAMGVKSAELPDSWIDEQVLRRNGFVVSAHVPSRFRIAVERIAHREGRSISSVMKDLLRDALLARGELAPGNDPVFPINDADNVSDIAAV